MESDPSAETPFADAVARYLSDVTTPFSTPGHKRNPALVGTSTWLLGDAPHHGGADDLRGSQGLLPRAEELAARAWGADFARFSHNGSTRIAALTPAFSASASSTCAAGTPSGSPSR